ncbi:M23 family metallopeptidase [Defluviitalea phaphyphila]|uniref:M23 family metallopeptidase n=1 Tax=Defluviitalea phaphyphila TaxID=1473580 RepID=UPI00072FB080|nr:M23 family metallopeptidase [Defluviitalea phaphyphila]
MSIEENKDTVPAAVSLTGAAAPATYVTTTDKIIKDDTKGIGREFVKDSLESNVKGRLIKEYKVVDSKGEPIKEVAITETEKAMAKAKAAKAKMTKSKYGFNNNKNDDIATVTTDQRSSVVSAEKENKGKPKKKTKRNQKSKKEKLSRNIENLVTQVAQNKDETLGDRVKIHTIRYGVRYSVKAPRYTRNIGKAVAAPFKGARFVSKLYKDTKRGVLTAKEARLLALKHGAKKIKEISKTASRSVISTAKREIEEFYGSDDLGIEAVRKTKDTIIKTHRTLKTTSRVTKKTIKTTKKTIKKLKKISKKTIKYTYRGIRLTAKILMNPIVLKVIAMALIVALFLITIFSGVAAIASVFSSFTYSSDDDVLSDTYAYVTELDTELFLEIQNIPNDPKWSYIDKFHINVSEPKTDPIPIMSYLSVKYDDFKLNNKIKKEIKKIHSELYEIQYYEWVETRNYSDGENEWTEHIYHLRVTLDTMSWESYIEKHKDEMFPEEDDYQRYEAYNNIGGTTLRTELGCPFPGEVVEISSRYGYRVHPINLEKEFHTGIDIPMPSGTPICATMSGEVTTGYDDGYGNYVIITSGERKTLYAHCQTIKVTNGQQVRRGEVIATVGSTGLSTGPHLHLEFEKDGKKLNPEFYIEREQFAKYNNQNNS